MLYLVTYFYNSHLGSGFGNSKRWFNHDVPTIKDIRDVEMAIESELGHSRVTVLSLIPLSDEVD